MKPAAYDSAKDVCLDRETSERDENNMLEASVRSYDGAAPRLQLGRYYRSDGRAPWRFQVLRRLSLADGRALVRLADLVLTRAEKRESSATLCKHSIGDDGMCTTCGSDTLEGDR